MGWLDDWAGEFLSHLPPAEVAATIAEHKRVRAEALIEHGAPDSDYTRCMGCRRTTPDGGRLRAMLRDDCQHVEVCRETHPPQALMLRTATFDPSTATVPMEVPCECR